MKPINRLLSALFLSCLKATELIEKASVTKLNLIDEKRLNFHLNNCSLCAQYKKQSVIMESMIARLTQYHTDKHLQLSEETKNEIIKIIEKNSTY